MHESPCTQQTNTFTWCLRTYKLYVVRSACKKKQKTCYLTSEKLILRLLMLLSLLFLSESYKKGALNTNWKSTCTNELQRTKITF